MRRTPENQLCPLLPQRPAECVREFHFALVAIHRLRQHHVEECVGDARNSKAALEGCDRLEQVDALAAIDHRGIVLVTVEYADHVVALETGEQSLPLILRPPMWRTSAVIIV